MKEFVAVIFGLGLLCNALLFVPQVIAVWRKKSDEGISLITFGGFSVLQAIGIVHGVVPARPLPDSRHGRQPVELRNGDAADGLLPDAALRSATVNQLATAGDATLLCENILRDLVVPRLSGNGDRNQRTGILLFEKRSQRLEQE